MQADRINLSVLFNKTFMIKYFIDILKRGCFMQEGKIEKNIVFSSTGEEIRVAVLENEILSEIFFEDMETEKNSGKIFIGRIENEVPSLEAFFVNIGMKKNGFLRFKDLISIPSDYKRGDMVVVQVKKDGNVRKGPQLSMQINIPGRYIVYMPYGEGSIGISRKLNVQSERERIREIAEDLIYDTEGIIFRTNCQNVDRETISDELNELRKQWHKIAVDYKNASKPKLAYSEDDFIDYIIRERVDSFTKKITVDSRQLYNQVKYCLKNSDYDPFVEIINKDPFFEMNIYSQMDDIFARKIELRNGGTITIDRTEAMTVIDVDSAGNIRGKNIEETSFETNLQAAKEITRQLRLRNIAGIVIIDFIDMHLKSHHEKITEVIAEEAKKDKARITVVGFTELGLLEVTRKRTSPAIDSLLFTPCPICHGTGRVAAPSVVFGRLIKDIDDSLKEMKDHDIKEVVVSVYHNLSGYATFEKKDEIEKKNNVKIKFEFNWNDPNSYNIRYKK